MTLTGRVRDAYDAYSKLPAVLWLDTLHSGRTLVDSTHVFRVVGLLPVFRPKGPVTYATEAGPPDLGPSGRATEQSVAGPPDLGPSGRATEQSVGARDEGSSSVIFGRRAIG
jgi:hypothetical protein